MDVVGKDGALTFRHDENMIRRKLVGLMAGSIWLLWGCSSDLTGAGSDRLSVHMDQASYSLASDSIASIALQNASGAAIYLPMGEYVLYERRVGGKWVDARPWFVVDGVGPSIGIPPGATRIDQFELWFYLRDQPGTYRIQYLAYEDDRLRRALPLRQRVSAPFTVTR